MRIYQRHRELAKGCVRADAGRIILTRPVGSIFQRGITCTSTHVVFRWSVFPSCTGAKHVPVIAASWNIVLRGATTFSKLGVQFLGLGYCTEQNTDCIPSFVHCSLLRNGNHTLHQKSWGGPSKFWEVWTPNPPVVAPLIVLQFRCSVTISSFLTLPDLQFLGPCGCKVGPGPLFSFSLFAV